MLWLLVPLALAGDVYVNGVDVQGLKDTTFEDVTVVFDSAGDVHIDAPGYRIEVEQPAPSATVPPAPAAVPEAATRPARDALGGGQWWLVTEDNGSTGHQVRVLVNGQLVRAVASGEPQVILDVGGYLQLGENIVEVRSTSTAPTGGTFWVYLGRGSNDSGTIVMDSPEVQYGLSTSRTGSHSRKYTLDIEP